MSTDELDAFVPSMLRRRIEERYWAPIGAAAELERWIDDGELHRAPDRHPALFSDHGVVHVRDIAANAMQVARSLPGTLLPPRDEAGSRFVAGVAALLTYVHDIGMVEPTSAGRRVHPQFAAQTVLGEGFDALASALWDADASGLRTRLLAVEREVGGAAFAVPLPTVAREVIACALAHSKTAVPKDALDDRRRLRRILLRGVSTALHRQQHPEWTVGADHDRDRSAPSDIAGRYVDVDVDAFA